MSLSLFVSTLCDTLIVVARYWSDQDWLKPSSPHITSETKYCESPAPDPRTALTPPEQHVVLWPLTSDLFFRQSHRGLIHSGNKRSDIRRKVPVRIQSFDFVPNSIRNTASDPSLRRNLHQDTKIQFAWQRHRPESQILWLNLWQNQKHHEFGL